MACFPLPVSDLDDVALGRVVAQELLDEVDVREDHAPAAVSVQAELIHSVARFTRQPVALASLPLHVV